MKLLPQRTQTSQDLMKEIYDMCFVMTESWIKSKTIIIREKMKQDKDRLLAAIEIANTKLEEHEDFTGALGKYTSRYNEIKVILEESVEMAFAMGSQLEHKTFEKESSYETINRNTMLGRLVGINTYSSDKYMFTYNVTSQEPVYLTNWAHMMFHCSMDWLIPVIRIIEEKTNCSLVTNRNKAAILPPNNTSCLFESEKPTLVESVYEVVCQFVESQDLSPELPI